MLIERKKCPLCNNAIYKQLYSINYNDKRITNYFLHFYGRKKLNFFTNLKILIMKYMNAKCKFIFQKNIQTIFFLRFYMKRLCMIKKRF